MDKYSSYIFVPLVPLMRSCQELYQVMQQAQCDRPPRAGRVAYPAGYIVNGASEECRGSKQAPLPKTVLSP